MPGSFPRTTIVGQFCKANQFLTCKQMAVLSDANSKIRQSRQWILKIQEFKRTKVCVSSAFKQVKGSHNFEAKRWSCKCGTGVHSGEARVFVVTQEFYINIIYIYTYIYIYMYILYIIMLADGANHMQNQGIWIWLSPSSDQRILRIDCGVMERIALTSGRKWISRLKWF